MILLLFGNKYNIYSEDPTFMQMLHTEYVVKDEPISTIVKDSLTQYFIEETP